MDKLIIQIDKNTYFLYLITGNILLDKFVCNAINNKLICKDKDFKIIFMHMLDLSDDNTIFYNFGGQSEGGNI